MFLYHNYVRKEKSFDKLYGQKNEEKLFLLFS